jgi:hypothetical protein
LSKVFIFAAGAAIGSAVTWKIVKDKYAQIAQEEIDSVKEVFSRKSYEEVKKDSAEYEDILNNNGYTNYSDNSTVQKENKEVTDVTEPYVIHPDDFGENDEYETESLIYFADGVLTDDDYEPIEDIESMVGSDSLTHFGEYEDDSVFVRNDELQTDYEILLDTRKYSDLNRPRPVNKG